MILFGLKIKPLNGVINTMVREDENHAFKYFMKDCVNDLINGETIQVYYDYQLDELVNRFGADLTFTFNQEEKWWSCTLNGDRKSRKKYKTKKYKRARLRPDITKEIVQELRNQGYTFKEIAKKLNCGISVIVGRLEEEDD